MTPDLRRLPIIGHCKPHEEKGETSRIVGADIPSQQHRRRNGAMHSAASLRLKTQTKSSNIEMVPSPWTGIL